MSLGKLKCSIPKQYEKNGLYLYSKQYFGACDKLKQMVFCTMPFSDYYIKDCKLNTHKCKCEEQFKKSIRNQTPISERTEHENTNYYDPEIDDMEPFPSDITSKDYFYDDY
uniref:Plasmodium vivax Vir protein n=1 Tax=Strongyloides venezuelensis TaxID=75913 RepID=A0A0K0FMC9_STRVS